MKKLLAVLLALFLLTACGTGNNPPAETTGGDTTVGDTTTDAGTTAPVTTEPTTTVPVTTDPSQTQAPPDYMSNYFWVSNYGELSSKILSESEGFPETESECVSPSFYALVDDLKADPNSIVVPFYGNLPLPLKEGTFEINVKPYVPGEKELEICFWNGYRKKISTSFSDLISVKLGYLSAEWAPLAETASWPELFAMIHPKQVMTQKDFSVGNQTVSCVTYAYADTFFVEFLYEGVVVTARFEKEEAAEHVLSQLSIRPLSDIPAGYMTDRDESAVALTFGSVEDLHAFMTAASLEQASYKKTPFADGIPLDAIPTERKQEIEEALALYREAEYLSLARLFDLPQDGFDLCFASIYQNQDGKTVFCYQLDSVEIRVELGGEVRKDTRIWEEYGICWNQTGDLSSELQVGDFAVYIDGQIRAACACRECKGLALYETALHPHCMVFLPAVDFSTIDFPPFAEKIKALNEELK